MCSVPYHDHATIDLGADPQAGLRHEIRDRPELQPTLFGSDDDRMGKRVFGLALNRRSEREHVVLFDRANRLDGDQLGLALGKRARLVDDERIDLLECL